MAYDKLTLVNEAAALIGADPLDALDEDTPSGQAVDRCYDSLLRWCMGLAVDGWSFGTATRQLTRREGVTVLSGWTYAFALPPERLGPPMKISPRADWPRVKFTDYTIEGNDVHADAEQLYALIRVMPEPLEMPPAFLMAFKTGLAADMAYALASDRETRAQMRNEAFGPPSAGGLGGLMGTALQLDRSAQPSRGPVSSYDPFTAAWRSGESFP